MTATANPALAWLRARADEANLNNDATTEAHARAVLAMVEGLEGERLSDADIALIRRNAAEGWGIPDHVGLPGVVGHMDALARAAEGWPHPLEGSARSRVLDALGVTNAFKAVEVIATRAREAAELRAEADGWRRLVNPFIEWAQDALDSGRWAGRSVFDGVRTELLEARARVAELETQSAQWYDRLQRAERAAADAGQRVAGLEAELLVQRGIAGAQKVYAAASARRALEWAAWIVEAGNPDPGDRADLHAIAMIIRARAATQDAPSHQRDVLGRRP